MITTNELATLRRRVIEIDYLAGHRHAPTSLSALPIIADIFDAMDHKVDKFVLSKGHSCSALYAVLERYGFKPDISKIHPERDPANGIEITSGSLGHGLPIAVGMAQARSKTSKPGRVHVLLGDGECHEGTTWEALHLARRLHLQEILMIHVDVNGYQGAGRTMDSSAEFARHIFPVTLHRGRPGAGVRFFEDRPGDTVHKITPAEFAIIMEEFK